jgi:hypothetical protein
MRSILVTADAQALPRLFVTTANFADENQSSRRLPFMSPRIQFPARYRVSAIGSAVVDLIRSIAKRDVTFFSGTVPISFL